MWRPSHPTTGIIISSRGLLRSIVRGYGDQIVLAGKTSLRVWRRQSNHVLLFSDGGYYCLNFASSMLLSLTSVSPFVSLRPLASVHSFIITPQLLPSFLHFLQFFYFFFSYTPNHPTSFFLSDLHGCVSYLLSIRMIII